MAKFEWSFEARVPVYEDMVRMLGVSIEAQLDAGDYSGDSYMLLRRGNELGYLQFGWGSCSGCDALEGCEGDVAAYQALLDDLERSVEWHGDLPALIRFREEADWENKIWDVDARSSWLSIFDAWIESEAKR